MSGPAAVPIDSYWTTVDYGLCVGSPSEMRLWTDLISAYVGAMVARYGVQEVESWMWVLWNEPGGVNAYSKEWETGGFSYYEMFFNTSWAIKKHSRKILFGGISESILRVIPSHAKALMRMVQEQPERAGAFDFFTYHVYCGGDGYPYDEPTNLTIVELCVKNQLDTVASLRQVLPRGMPIYLEETGSAAGPYNRFHDSTGEAAFVVPYVAGLHAANLSGAHWWCSSDIYTEHGELKNYTWIPHEDYSGGMPRAEFTGRWGFTSPR